MRIVPQRGLSVEELMLLNCGAGKDSGGPIGADALSPSRNILCVKTERGNLQPVPNGELRSVSAHFGNLISLVWMTVYGEVLPREQSLGARPPPPAAGLLCKFYVLWHPQSIPPEV